jgi:pseudouridine kinase
VIVAVGGALADVHARTVEAWHPGRSLPGRVRLKAGGAARNVAVDLAHLGHRVALLSVVGDDPLAELVLGATASAGVDVGGVIHLSGQTGVFVTVGATDGLPWCVADARLLEALGPRDVAEWEVVLARATLVILDANLQEETAAALIRASAGRPRALLTTSRAKAARLRGVLPGTTLVIGQREEAAVLAGLSPGAAWREVGGRLRALGVDRAVLTLGQDGVAVVDGTGEAWTPAAEGPLVDATGAGDAVAAAAVHAWTRTMSGEETAFLARAAAAVAVGSEDTTPPALAQVVRR